LRIILTLIFLAACGSVNVSTLVQLNRFDPLTTDPEGFVIAVVLPMGLDVPQNSVRLVYQWASDTDTIGGDYMLQRQSEFARHGIPLAAGHQLFFFNLSNDAAAQLRDVQQNIAVQKAADVDGAGTIAVYAMPCLTQDTMPEAPLISTYLRIETGASFLPLLQDFDINKIAQENGSAGMPQCE